MNLKCALQRQEADLSGYKLGAAFFALIVWITQNSQRHKADWQTQGQGWRCWDKRQQGIVLTEQTAPGCMLLETLRTRIQ